MRRDIRQAMETIQLDLFDEALRQRRKERAALAALVGEIKQHELKLQNLGYGVHYCIAIQNSLNPYCPKIYNITLRRTIRQKEWRQKKFPNPTGIVKNKRKNNYEK